MDLIAARIPPTMRVRIGGWGPVRRLGRWSRNASVAQVRDVPDNVPPAATVPLVADEIPIALMGTRPSYRYKLEEMKRRGTLLSSQFDLRDPLFDINDKYQAYDFADRHGVDHPIVYGAYGSIDEVQWNDLPHAFVLKTRWGSSNIGVKALIRDGADGYQDLLRSRPWSTEEILEDQRRKEGEGLVSESLFAEELITKEGQPRIADDWKFYCFNGRVGLSMQRDVRGTADMSEWRFRFRDRQWNDLGPIKFVDRLDPSLEDPRYPDELIALAEKLSVIIGRPFIRIDLFESDRGPVLGEFTPAPGPPEVFTPEVDEMLGTLWEEAEAQRFANEIETGVWRHLEV